MMTEAVDVKLSLKFEEHRLLQLARSSASINELKDKIKRNFPLVNHPSVDLKIFWTDKDNDRISISTDDDLKQALKAVNGKLKLDIALDIRPQTGPQRQLPVLEEFQVSYPPDHRSSYHHSPPVETVSRSYLNQTSRDCQNEPRAHTPVPERQDRPVPIPLQSNPSDDQLDLPVDIPLFEEWPTQESYALSMISKSLQKQLDHKYTNNKKYEIDPGHQCRVLCILNKDSRGKDLYPGSNMDSECTFLQQLCKKLNWSLQLHKNKTSEDIEEILNAEMERNFDVSHSLFVIIVTRGDRDGIYGTQGGLVEYWKITTRFDDVVSLKGKPKIFLIDDCEIGSDIHDEINQYGVQESNITQMPVTSLKELVSPINLSAVLVDQMDSQPVSNKSTDTYICKASTMGRCDKVVKGSWLIGALISVMCKAANRMTFQQMMKQVKTIFENASVPNGKPNPDMKITDDLTKDFYLLPAPC